MDVSPSRNFIGFNKKLAERVGFEKALSDRLFAFNMMPKTDVFTVTYLLSHLEHESQKKR